MIAVVCKSNQCSKIIKDDFGSSISVVLDNPSDYGLSDIDASSDIEILNEININNISNDKGNVISIPVIIDGNIELIYSISLTACSYNVSVGKDYAPLLNEMKRTDTTKFILSKMNTHFMLFPTIIFTSNQVKK